MINLWYNSDEVTGFHPVVETTINNAIVNCGFDSVLELVHHPSIPNSTIIPDFAIKLKSSNRYIFVIEVKKTARNVKSQRFQNQAIIEGEDAFVILPHIESDLVGKIKAPTLNSGKIKIGQEVNIRLVNYPDREFGIIKGSIKSISLTPDKENNLLIDVILPDGLKTSYNRNIIFQQEMTGTADIITEDSRLLERLLYQLRDIFRRK